MGTDGKGLKKSENFIENYGFTNTLAISVGAMLLYYSHQTSKAIEIASSKFLQKGT